MGMIIGSKDWLEYEPGLGNDGIVRDEDGAEISPFDDDYEYYKHLNDDDDHSMFI